MLWGLIYRRYTLCTKGFKKEVKYKFCLKGIHSLERH